LRGVSFARAWSEDDLEAVTSVARVIDAKPGRAVFPAGASASDFGVLLAGSSFCSDEDGEESLRMTFRAPDTSNTNRESKQTTFGTNVHSFTASAGSMVGAVAFAAALFRPAVRPTSVLAGARGASVAVFDAAALETLDKRGPDSGSTSRWRRRAPPRRDVRRSTRATVATTKTNRPRFEKKKKKSAFPRTRSCRSRPRRRCASRRTRGRGARGERKET
jgi:hypothetical protein